jgi:hypothetical protein
VTRSAMSVACTFSSGTNSTTTSGFGLSINSTSFAIRSKFAAKSVTMRMFWSFSARLFAPGRLKNGLMLWSSCVGWACSSAKT